MKFMMILPTLVALALGACALRPSRPEWNFGRYHFNYFIENGESINLTQVFDDGEYTYLQLSDPARIVAQAALKNARGKRLHGTVQGDFVRLKGTYELLEVTLRKGGGASATRIYTIVSVKK